MRTHGVDTISTCTCVHTSCYEVVCKLKEEKRQNNQLGEVVLYPSPRNLEPPKGIPCFLIGCFGK